MKTKTLIMLAILFVTSMNLESCKKQCPAPEEPSRREILLNGTWHATVAEGYQDGNLVTTNDISQYDWQFMDNGKMLSYNTQNNSGQLYGYVITGDVEKITFTADNGDVYPMNVLKLEKDKMELEAPVSANAKYIYYFER
ncbi:MAG: hypothetical protein GXO24_01575 [Chlorobi bacterium]|nr:hypothetical protein [Chlorobiota bacterium]